MSKHSKKRRNFIPVDEAVARWRRDPAYVKEYDALEEEFVSAMIKARARRVERSDDPMPVEIATCVVSSLRSTQPTARAPASA